MQNKRGKQKISELKNLTICINFLAEVMGGLLLVKTSTASSFSTFGHWRRSLSVDQFSPLNFEALFDFDFASKHSGTRHSPRILAQRLSSTAHTCLTAAFKSMHPAATTLSIYAHCKAPVSLAQTSQLLLLTTFKLK